MVRGRRRDAKSATRRPSAMVVSGPSSGRKYGVASIPPQSDRRSSGDKAESKVVLTSGSGRPRSRRQAPTGSGRYNRPVSTRSRSGRARRAPVRGSRSRERRPRRGGRSRRACGPGQGTGGTGRGPSSPKNAGRTTRPPIRSRPKAPARARVPAPQHGAEPRRQQEDQPEHREEVVALGLQQVAARFTGPGAKREDVAADDQRQAAQDEGPVVTPAGPDQQGEGHAQSQKDLQPGDRPRSVPRPQAKECRHQGRRRRTRRGEQTRPDGRAPTDVRGQGGSVVQGGIQKPTSPASPPVARAPRLAPPRGRQHAERRQRPGQHPDRREGGRDRRRQGRETPTRPATLRRDAPPARRRASPGATTGTYSPNTSKPSQSRATTD